MRSILLVKPENPRNTGFIARLAQNFDYELELLEPGFNLSEARQTANNAQEKLESARIHRAEETAFEGEYLVGSKPGKEPLREQEPRENIKLVVGPESSGLSSSEMEKCDSVASIETPGYSSLSQSHAAAIMMHHFVEESADERMTAGQMEKIRELAPAGVASALVSSAPDREEAGRIIQQLRDW
jgi:tRNA C32,U32 (ribose-2'-O)-methylase TrmJ